MSQPDGVLRASAAEHLSDTLTPMLSIRNHGLEPYLRELARRTAAEHSAARDATDDPPDNFAHDLSAKDLEEARAGLTALCCRLLGMLLGEEEAQRHRLHGRLCLRVYPAQPVSALQCDGTNSTPSAASPPASTRLGAHCDATLFTLLWSDAPGLQVLDPVRAARSGWTVPDVVHFGIPFLGPVDCADDEEEGSPPELQDSHWATVEQPWSEGALLFSLGTAWDASGIGARELPNVRGAVLHRVATCAGQPARHSLPFLVDLAVVAEEEDPAAMAAEEGDDGAVTATGQWDAGVGRGAKGTAVAVAAAGPVAAVKAATAAPVVPPSPPPLPPLPPAFAALADRFPPPVRAIIVDGVEPSTVPFDALLDSLGLEPHYAEHSYAELRSLRLLRMARGLPPEPPLTHASDADLLRRPGALSPAACRALCDLVDSDARRSAAADSVDGAPDHQVDISSGAQLAELIGEADARALWQLAAEFRHARHHGSTPNSARHGAWSRRGDGGDGGGGGGGASPSATPESISPSEIFVRRYTPNTRPWIPFHCDRAACTINVSLADDACHDGGRLVAIIGGCAQAIERDEGEATVHSSRLCHAVSRMRAGVRYSLIVFVP